MFFFNDTATTEIYTYVHTLSLHDALPICDANCPYCNAFWEAARPWVDSGKVQLRHILVGIIKDDSPAKAAAILGAPDRSAALLTNERQFGQGGITPAKSVPADVRKILDDNLALMASTGFRDRKSTRLNSSH